MQSMALRGVAKRVAALEWAAQYVEEMGEKEPEKWTHTIVQECLTSIAHRLNSLRKLATKLREVNHEDPQLD